jgi:hypothetical protein
MDELTKLIKKGYEERATLEHQERNGIPVQPPAQAGPSTPPVALPPLPPPIAPAPSPVASLSGISLDPPRELPPLHDPRTASRRKRGKKSDPEYTFTGVSIHRSLHDRGKILAVRMDCDFADVVNMALYYFLEPIEEELNPGQH